MPAVRCVSCCIVLKMCMFCVQSCVSVFKSLSVLEKSVDKCKISMQPDEERLIFQLYCHHGIILFFLRDVLYISAFGKLRSTINTYCVSYQLSVTLHYIIKLFIVAQVKNCKVRYIVIH